ncbi:MAG: thioredoxin family protein [Gammaproteobacteria bacterium]
MRRYHFSFLAFFILVLFSQASIASVGRDPSTHFFNETWGNFQEELVKAREEGKKGILLFFEIDIFPFCHRMNRTVLNQPEVQDYFRENFLIFGVDVEGDVEMVDFDGKTINQTQVFGDGLSGLSVGKKAQVIIGKKAYQGEIYHVALSPVEGTTDQYTVDMSFKIGDKSYRAGQPAEVRF